MKFITLCFLIFYGHLAYSQDNKIVVIVHPKDTYHFNSIKKIREAWLLKTKIGKNLYALPVNKYLKSPEATIFYEVVLKMTTSQVSEYFFYLQYSDAILPPVELPSDEAVISYINSNPHALGYINLSSLNSDNTEKMKVICIIEKDKITFY